MAGKRMVAHIDEAPWRYGRTRNEGEEREETWRFFGDFEEGPWVSIIERPAGLLVKPHSHNADEFVYIIEGGFTLDDGRWCGPGTMLYFPANHLYGFRVGDDGVKWLMTRTNAVTGESQLDWVENKEANFEEWFADYRKRQAEAKQALALD